jgi:CRISPR/Cas system CMR-associated protein Cmr3 (group 5 of RAMP superfamily)
MLTTTYNCTELLSPIYIRPSQAKLFGLSKSHIWSLIKNKDIPSYLPTPKLRLIKVQDLINYIENTKMYDIYDVNEIYKKERKDAIQCI